MAAPKLYRIPEAAALLGVSRQTVYNLISSGALESCDIAPPGSTRPMTRVSDAEIERFIKARSRKAKHLRSA
jgi:excisionase family DNA binding protein